MSNKTNRNNKGNNNPLTNQQGSGSEYHREHAGNVEGYGEPYPNNGSVENLNTANKQ